MMGKSREYKDSLKQALEIYKNKLEENDSEYNQLALKTLHRLEEEVYSKIIKGS